ncbi:RAMP superfamily CRISPR-associated protein [Rhodococcus sp. 14-2483-1-2]|uniref:RAMP superfamily CRISPR-associated protein n=1 Tax=Rhodococcus sp. 14-2483-1-2 TaxID=2023147 RepID=UPI000B9AE3E0|nr:RAMP superfamily CRISPR-associated protein [Rhodococcus sp. 14-2483-1-2]OZF37304.1 hypothetical protein CH295_06440 [Rhodococcus sp. 14-2483-1-2]
MADKAFDIEIAFRSDWHIGTGTGRHGSIDRSIVTDAIGLPYVPAKTAVGMLRDSAEIAANALDDGGAGVWTRWIRAIFGDQPSTTVQRGAPRPASLMSAPLLLADRESIAHASLSPAGASVLTRADLIAATKTLRAGIRIDATTGVAQEDMFRIEERARAGLTVRARWQVEYPQSKDSTGATAQADEIWPAEFLLLAAAKITRQIGGKRRRGAGRADIKLSGLETLSVLTEKVRAGTIPEPWTPPLRPRYTPTRSSGSTARRPLRLSHTITVTTQQPLIIDSGQRGNVVETATSIPGTMLLGPLGRHLPNLSDLIRAGEFVVTDATVEIDGARGLPWPRALNLSKDAPASATKGEPHEYVNVLRPHQENPRLKPKPDRYVDSACTSWRTVDVVQSIHASIDDQQQRPTEATGGLFVYSGIAPGTVLRAEVFLAAGVTLADSTQQVRIGRSSKDDYGLATLVITSSEPVEASSEILAESAFPVWLTSDLLLRDERGAADTRASSFVDALARALGVPGKLRLAPTSAESADGAPFADVADSAATGLARRHSWQRSWGLPRPSLSGLAAGSVVLIVSQVRLDPTAIAGVEANGVGDRTAEGFGRVLVDPPALRANRLDLREWSLKSGAPSTADVPVATPVADAHIRAAWRTVIERTALRVAALENQATGVKSAITRSQWGSLRGIVNRAGDVEAARAWRTAPKRESRWGAAQLNGMKLLLETDSGAPDHPIWHKLFGATPDDLPPSPYAELTRWAVQSYLTELIRLASRDASNEGSDI